MTKGRLIASKVIVGIICALLILASITMAIILGITSKGLNTKPDALTVLYDYLPNTFGDEGVYVSKNFFVENNLQIPKYVEVYGKHYTLNGYYNKDLHRIYSGRTKDWVYSFSSDSLDSNEQGKISVYILCNPTKDIEQLQNKQKHNGYSYGLTMNESRIKSNDGSTLIPVTSYNYTLNLKRSEKTSKKCQLTMSVSIKHENNIQLDEFKKISDKLFYSMLENLVYRNI